MSLCAVNVLLLLKKQLGFQINLFDLLVAEMLAY